MSLTFKEFTDFVTDVTANTHDIITNAYKADVQNFNYKEDLTIVTAIDLQIEQFIRNRIVERFSKHNIIGEEFEDYINSGANYWIIDPIDGTLSFARKVPLFGTMIGFMANDNPLYGCLHLPKLDNKLLTGDNENCFLDGKKLKSPPFTSWKDALVLTTDENRVSNSSYSENWQKLKKLDATFRTWGDCFGYYLLCIGEADLMFDIDLKPYDILPLLPILYGAGLSVLDLSEHRNYSTVIACKKELEDDIKEMFLD